MGLQGGMRKAILSFFYRSPIQAAAALLALALYIGGWKKAVLRENLARCGLRVPFFRLRFYAHAAGDLLLFLAGRYGRSIRMRSRDQAKLKKLKSGASLFLTAHFHHWELMGGWLISQDVPLLSAARPMAQARAQSLLKRLRSRLQSPTLETGVARGALRHLDRQGCFALLWDQRPSRSDLRADFFGHRLRMDPLPAFLHRHRVPDVWFGTLLPDGTFRLLLLSPAGSCRSPTPEGLARRYHRVLELLVRRHPTWWYGMAHRRFQDAQKENPLPLFHVKHPSHQGL
jgi:lauroyl/myristoyl acyltransferase